jgi:tRNA G18 (ribose-2'-O)-methylase SpoU
MIHAMAAIAVDDPADPRIADYRNVPDPELIERRGIFVAEGRLVVRRLLESRRMGVRSVMVTGPAHEALGDALVHHPDVPVYLVPQGLMASVTGFNIHRGCLAIGERSSRMHWRELARDADRMLVLERIANADNVGAAFRNAAAFDVDAVLLGPACTDPLYRKAIRTSMGAALSIPFASARPWPDALVEMRRLDIAVVGMTPAASAPPLHRALASVHGRPVAIVVGHESEGLSAEALAACELLARIPMADGVDSVNVATAAAIALYELGFGSKRSRESNRLSSDRGTAAEHER